MSEKNYIPVIGPRNEKPRERSLQWVGARQGLYDSLGHTNITVDVVTDADSDLLEHLITMHAQGQALQGPGPFKMEAVPPDLLMSGQGFFMLSYILRGGPHDVAIAFGRNQQGAWEERYAGTRPQASRPQ